MNTVSFGSTYKINAGADIRNNGKLVDFCSDNNLDYSTKVESKRGYLSSKPSVKINTTIIAPDQKDNILETYLANQGIKFKKLDTKELLSKSKVESRIEKPVQDRKLVKINAQKLEKLARNQDQNIDYCEDNYEKYYKDSVDLMIKSGDKIPATSLFITPLGESTEDTVKYIKNFGADRLNDSQLSFWFNQECPDSPDHCMFFGMKDLGMNSIPVYVDNDTYKIADALGIISK